MKKILVIEDVKSVRNQIVSVLTSAGFDVKGAEDGIRGMELAKKYLPDLVICDIVMPDFDGYSVLDELRTRDTTKTIPFIFTTVKSERQDIRKGMISGADDYLVKPFSTQELLDSVNSQLEKQKKFSARTELTTRERLQYLLSTSPAVIYSSSHSDFNRFTYISENVTSLTGYDPGDFMVPPFWSDHIHPEDLSRILPELPIIFKQNRIIHEYRFLHRDGNYRWIHDERKIIPDSSGHPKEIVGSWLDITEKKTAEEDRMRLIHAVEQLEEGIIITDADENIQYVNSAFERLSDYTMAELMGKTPWGFRNGQSNREIYASMRDTVSCGDIWKGRFTIKKKDGTDHDIKAVISPVKDNYGKIINYVGVMDDITNEVTLEKQLRQAQKMEVIGTLAGGISHDFRNILAIIQGYAEMALYAPPKKNIRFYIEEILRAGNRVNELVMQILTFSRPGDDEKNPVKISPIIKESLKMLRAAVPSNIQFRKNLKARSDVIIGNPTQISQLLLNLCANAVHAMKEKGGTLEISLSNTELTSSEVSQYPGLTSGPYINLTVSDTGHGMTEDIMARIFEPFFTTREVGEGTGMGLAIVQGIVKNLGGAITVYSEPWVGSSFQVLLPEIKGKGLIKTESLRPVPSGNKTILFVDDEKSLVYLTKEMLEELGHRVFAAVSSMEALEIFKSDM